MESKHKESVMLVNSPKVFVNGTVNNKVMVVVQVKHCEIGLGLRKLKRNAKQNVGELWKGKEVIELRNC